MLNQQAKNIEAIKADYKKRGQENREKRAEQIAFGSPMTEQEQAAKLELDIKEIEGRLGFDGFDPNEPRVHVVTGSTARSAWTEPTYNELVY